MLGAISILVSTALAQDAAPPAVAPAPGVACPTKTPFDSMLAEVDRLIAAGNYTGARTLLKWLSAQYLPPDVRAEVDARFAGLHASSAPESTDWAARARLLPWQTLMGGYLLGPNIAFLVDEHSIDSDGDPGETTILSGAVLGAIGGAALSVSYRHTSHVTQGQVSAILLGEQLGMANGGALGLLLPENEYTSFPPAPDGLLLGGIAGTAAGYAWASRNPAEGPMAGAHAGSLWGAGIASLVLLADDSLPDNPFFAVGAIVASGDLGAVAGAKIADGAHLRERDVQIITAGGVVGVSLVILLESTDTRGEYEMPEAVLAITGAVAGGGFGWAIARSTEPHLPPLALGAFVSGTPDHLVFGLPVPTVFPTASGLNAQASLVAIVF